LRNLTENVGPLREHVTVDEKEPTPETLKEKYERLNRQFYVADPDSYFQARSLMLLVLGGRPSDVLGLLSEGVMFGHLKSIGDFGIADENGLQQYVAIESQVLLHQAAETLLRLYLGHLDRPPCPWLEIASERQPGTFKTKVQESVLDPRPDELNDSVADLFLGGPWDGVCEDRRAETEIALRNLTRFLRSFAEQWLSDAPMYNSLKHGLSGVAGNVGLNFGESLDNMRQLGRGQSVTYLDAIRDRNEHGQKVLRWKQSTRWIDVSQTLAHIEVATRMIESLWRIAAHRYADREAPKGVYYPIATPEAFRSKDRLPARQWNISLGIEETL
jgi:hypothetical protein